MTYKELMKKLKEENEGGAQAPVQNTADIDLTPTKIIKKIHRRKTKKHDTKRSRRFL